MSAQLDPFARFANAARLRGKSAVDWVVRYFALGLMLASWVGSLFVADLLWPDSGQANPWTVAAAILIIVVGIFAIIMQGRDTTHSASLRDSVKELKSTISLFGEDYRGIWTFVLFRWASALGLDGKHRISIYKHNGSHFEMIARFSDAKPYAKRGRSIYPDNQGCIGEAWHAPDGKCLATGLSKPATARYRDRHVNAWNMPVAVFDALTMKSRAIYAIAIRDDGGQRHAIAVFESTAPDGLDAAAIDQFMAASGYTEANRWMAATKNHLPSIKLAQEAGL